MAASESAQALRRLFMTCKRTKKQFLVNTGSDVSIYSRSETSGFRQSTSHTLYTANGSHSYIRLDNCRAKLGIKTYISVAIYNR